MLKVKRLARFALDAAQFLILGQKDDFWIPAAMNDVILAFFKTANVRFVQVELTFLLLLSVSSVLLLLLLL